MSWTKRTDLQSLKQETGNSVFPRNMRQTSGSCRHTRDGNTEDYVSEMLCQRLSGLPCLTEHRERIDAVFAAVVNGIWGETGMCRILGRR